MHRQAARTLARWTRAAGPFWSYVAATPFVGGPEPTPGNAAEVDAAVAAASTMMSTQVLPLLAPTPGRMALLVDLPLRLSLGAAPSLLDAGCYVVACAYRWPTLPSLLPATPALALLTGIADRLRVPPAPRGVAVLLDSERADTTRRLDPGQFDGRYHYPPDVLPTPQALADWGVTSFATVTSTMALADDVGEVVDRYVRAGLAHAAIWVQVGPLGSGRRTG